MYNKLFFMTFQQLNSHILSLLFIQTLFHLLYLYKLKQFYVLIKLQLKLNHFYIILIFLMNLEPTLLLLLVNL